MRTLVRALSVCLLIIAGCGKNPERATPASPPSVETNSSSISERGDANMTGTLQNLTQAARRFGVEQRRVPKSLDELVTAGYVSSLPTPPAGKRFAINKQLEVYLADQ